jgi:hypothetical protein
MNTNIAYASGAQAQSPSVPAAEPQVSRQLSNLSKKTIELVESFKLLAQRLSPLLRQDDPGKAEGRPPMEVLVPLAGMVRDQAIQIETVTEGLQYLLNRLEL